jgi:anti-repressor protein
MNDIIKVNYANPDRPTVSGRELHEALGIETPYHKWFPRMCEYGFNEGTDFNTDKNVRVQIEGSREVTREITDHEISLDMAKELCMIQRSEIGKRFREYFIEVEKAWNDPVLVMGRAYEAQKAITDKLNAQVLELETKVAEDKPKVLFADAVETSHTSILIGDLAKLLKQNGVEMGQRRLFDWLRANGYLMKGGNSHNMPTQKAMELKLFEVKERTINNPDGTIRITKTPKVTGKGQTYFINKFLGDGKE